MYCAFDEILRVFVFPMAIGYGQVWNIGIMQHSSHHVELFALMWTAMFVIAIRKADKGDCIGEVLYF